MKKKLLLALALVVIVAQLCVGFGAGKTLAQAQTAAQAAIDRASIDLRIRAEEIEQLVQDAVGKDFYLFWSQSDPFFKVPATSVLPGQISGTIEIHAISDGKIATVSFKKNIPILPDGDGEKPTPSPSPDVSPSPGVSPTPDVSPSPTPSPGVSPSPTPSPGVSPSPTPSPGVSPTPGPTEKPVNPTPTKPGTPPSPTTAPSPLLREGAVPFASLTDVQGHWAEKNIKFAVDRGLMSGVGDGKFLPQATMSRSMWASVLHRLASCPKGETVRFSDVTAGQWYSDAVSWAATEKIMQGSGDAFLLSGPITREQLAVTLLRFSDVMGVKPAYQGSVKRSDFTDGGSVSPWAVEGMDWALKAGILSGKPGKKLDPQGSATRAEVSCVLENFVERTAS